MLLSTGLFTVGVAGLAGGISSKATKFWIGWAAGGAVLLIVLNIFVKRHVLEFDTLTREAYLRSYMFLPFPLVQIPWLGSSSMSELNNMHFTIRKKNPSGRRWRDNLTQRTKNANRYLILHSGEYSELELGPILNFTESWIRSVEDYCREQAGGWWRASEAPFHSTAMEVDADAAADLDQPPAGHRPVQVHVRR